MKETRFKDTEIGPIPWDWEVITLGSNSDIFRGGSPRPIEAFLTDMSSGINWIKIGDVKPDDKFIRETAEKIIPEGASRSRCVSPGDFILSNSMSFGRPYILAINGCIHDGWLVIKNYQNTFARDFLYYTLSSSVIINQYVSMAAGSSVKNLNKDKVAKIKIIAPVQLDEQNRIASALTSVDSLISSLDKLIAKKKDIKQGTMQQLLTGKKRLKGFTAPWVEKHLWEVTAWDKQFNEVDSDKQSVVVKYPYALANVMESMESKGGNVLLLSTGSYVGYTTEDKAGKYLCEGEVVAIPWGGVANVKYANGKFVTADNRIATSLNNQELSNRFLFYFMYQNTDLLNSFYRGAGIKHPSMADVLNIIIKYPSLAEQSAIASVLTSMDNEISALETKKAKYENIKQGMMQQLLSGKIRLID